MLKLRILLLRDIVFYIIFILSILYFVFVNYFVTYNSKYHNESSLTGIITNITYKDYGLKLDISSYEKFIMYYYIDNKDLINFKDTYEIGDKIEVDVKEIVVNNNTTPNTFNYKKYLYNKKIYKTFEIININKIKDNNNIFYYIKNVLYKRSLKLNKSYPYINTLLFGNKSDLNEDVYKSYQENGVSHLFAISGTHISIFIIIIEKILKMLKINENKRYLIIILFLCFFMFITNNPSSVVRASVFTILLLINKIFYFYIKPQNLLLLTISIILFINPLSIHDVGLQYSFIISMTLLLMGKSINKYKNKLKKLFVISLISFIISLPITIYNFYQINFLSIIYNMFFVPYVSFILLPLTILCYLFPFLDNLLFLFIKILESISLLLCKIDFFKLIICKSNVLIYILYIVSSILFLFGIKKFKIYKIIPLVVLIIINYNNFFIKKNEITFLDVGQGDSILLTLNDKTSLIDTGGIVMQNDSKYSYNLSKNIIIPYLKSLGIKKIDNLILTHGDIDHIKESLYIVDNYKIDNIYINSNDINYLEKQLIKKGYKKRIKINILNKNDLILIDKVKIKSLNGNNQNENDSSLVLYMNINNYKILLTGDISKNIEKEIIHEYNIKNIHILKLAHHGSNTSNDISFLKEVNPKYSIISAGLDNKYKHPSKETIDNLNELNLSYLETSKYGSITFDLKKGTIFFNKP